VAEENGVGLRAREDESSTSHTERGAGQFDGKRTRGEMTRGCGQIGMGDWVTESHFRYERPTGIGQTA